MEKRIVSIFLLALLCLPLPLQAKTDKYQWSEKAAPNYVVVIGKAKVKNKPKKGKIVYAKLDKYGRTGKVVGNITYGMVKKSAGWRESIQVDPPGWPANNSIQKIKLYNGRTYSGYFWNRSHLLADSLGGKPKKTNLITGTRMQNVGANDGKGGMAYTERKAVNWLKKHHKGTVFYAATPIYKGKEIIPRSVIVDIKTSDKKINQRVIVYNAAKGYSIDYNKATFKGKSSGSNNKKNTSSTVYITKTGKKYHKTKSCSGLRNAKSIQSSTLTDAKNKGLEPCKICY